jgi:hypothetical protein
MIVVQHEQDLEIEPPDCGAQVFLQTRSCDGGVRSAFRTEGGVLIHTAPRPGNPFVV